MNSACRLHWRRAQLAVQRVPGKQQDLREAAPQLNPPKTGPQQTLLSLMSFHCFILSASVISDFGLPPVVPHRPRAHRCFSFRLVCSEPAASSFLFFFLFVKVYKFKTCFSCVVFLPFFASSSVLRPPAWAQFQPFLLHTRLLLPQLHELSPTTVLSFSSHREELSSIVSSV